MNINEFLDTDFQVIGFHKDAVVLLSQEHKQTVVIKIDTIQRLLGKLVSEYDDQETIRDITHELETQ